MRLIHFVHIMLTHDRLSIGAMKEKLLIADNALSTQNCVAQPKPQTL